MMNKSKGEMAMKVKSKVVVALILVLTLLLSNVAYALDGLKADQTEKAAMELVYLVADTNEPTGYKVIEKDSLPQLSVNDTFFVGLQIRNLNNIVESDLGFLSVSTKISYDTTYLTLEPNMNTDKFESVSEWLESTKAGTPQSRMSYATSIFNEDNEAVGSYAYVYSVYSENTPGFVGIGIDWDCGTGSGLTKQPKIKGTTPFLLGILEFKVKGIPENGAKVFGLSEVTEDTYISFDCVNNIKTYAWRGEDNNATDNMTKVMNLDVTGVNIFPAGTVTLTADSTIAPTSGTGEPEYGVPLTATYNVKTADGSAAGADTYAAEWQRSADGNTWTTITQADESTEEAVPQGKAAGDPVTDPTYTPTKEDVGNYLRYMPVAASGYKIEAGSGGINSVQIKAKTLTLPTTITSDVPTAKVNNTTEANLKQTGTYEFTGAALVNSADKVTAKYTVDYTGKVSSTGTPTVDVVFKADSLDGADKDYYRLPTTLDKDAAGTKITATGAVVDKQLTGWEVTAPTDKATYTDGDTIALTGLKVTAEYDDNSTEDVTSSATIKVDGSAITAGTTTATLAMNGKAITVEYNSESKSAGTITVKPKASVDVTVTPGAATAKNYDGNPDGVAWTIEPQYEAPEGYILDTNEAVYAYTSANAGTGVNITVSGLKFTNGTTTATLKDASGNALTNVGTGDINQVKPTIKFGNLEQGFGSVKEVTATGTPASTEAEDKLVVEYYVVTKAANPGSPCTAADPTTCDHTGDCGYVAAEPETKEWVTWTRAEAILNAITTDTNIDVRAYAPTTGTKNYLAGSNADADVTKDVLKLANSGGGGGGAVSSGYTVRYNAGTNGTLTGSATEKVKKGETPANVPTVTAKDGFRFIGWSQDGKTVVDPTTVKITSSTTFTALYQAVKNTYISGYPDGTFRPNAHITRAEVASMLARLSKDFDAKANYTGKANDVAEGTWFTNFVNFGMEKGIISGYTDGTFRPDADITRGEFASMMARYMNLKLGGNATFADTNGHWASASIAALADKGIVTGYPDGGFHPNAQLTRAEAVQMINTALEVQALAGEAEVVPTDVTSAHWAYTQIIAAMNTDIRDIID